MADYILRLIGPKGRIRKEIRVAAPCAHEAEKYAPEVLPRHYLDISRIDPILSTGKYTDRRQRATTVEKGAY